MTECLNPQFASRLLTNCYAQNLKRIQILVSQGADVNTRFEFVITPLHIIVKEGN